MFGWLLQHRLCHEYLKYGNYHSAQTATTKKSLFLNMTLSYIPNCSFKWTQQLLAYHIHVLNIVSLITNSVYNDRMM